jgi:hypothetical protein
MAATIKSKRVQEFKAIYQKELGTFWTKYAALYGLLGMVSLSLVNRRWVEKRLNEMHAMFAGNSEQLAKLDELNLRNEDAKTRYAARLEKKEAKKSAKKGWRFGRPPKSAAPQVQAPVVNPQDRRSYLQSLLPVEEKSK